MEPPVHYSISPGLSSNTGVAVPAPPHAAQGVEGGEPIADLPRHPDPTQPECSPPGGSRSSALDTGPRPLQHKEGSGQAGTASPQAPSFTPEFQGGSPVSLLTTLRPSPKQAPGPKECSDLILPPPSKPTLAGHDGPVTSGSWT